ncbi:MAG: FGGY-family carbohydrate kinase [Sciscionella sp.]
MSALLLGIDIGTSSSKGVLTTATGAIVARAERGHVTSNPRPGFFEHDADAVWWRDFTTLCAELRAAAGTRMIAGVGVSGIGPCLLPADADGTPQRQAILYGVDSRAGAQIDELNAELGATEIRRIGGSPLTSQALGPKLRWLAQVEPAVYAGTEKFFSASNYLVYRLTGRYVLDHHSASQCTPLYDLTSQRWHEEWAGRIAPGLALPQLRWPNELAGVVTADAAAATGLPEGTPVTTGTIDAWAEATSVGVTHPGDVMVMYGTTMFLIQVTKDIASHPGLWSTTGVWPGSYTLAAGMATSGSITEWLAGLLGSDFATLTAEASASTAGANGLVLLPYFAGERTPLFDPRARGGVLGLTLAHTRGDLYRAVLEATAFGVRHNLDTMAEATGGRREDRRLVAVGGGTQAELWPKLVSDVTGLAQEVATETIGACLGDCLLAGVATGSARELQQWNPIVSTIVPDAGSRATYDRRYADYLELYRVSADIAHRLAADQEASAALVGHRSPAHEDSLGGG